MKSDDKDAIEAKTKALAEASGKMAERLYAEKAEDAAPGGGEAGGGDQAGTERASGGGTEDVVDAEFEEVKDDKK